MMGLRRGCFRRSAVLLCASGTAGEAKQPTFRQSPWEVLGVDRLSSQEDIKAAYQKLISKHHPDLGGSSEEFQKIHEAYQKVTTGAPLHMLSRQATREEIIVDNIRQKVDKLFSKTGATVHWEKMEDKYQNAQTAGGWGIFLRRFLMLGAGYWFCILCDPWKPHWFLFIVGAYWMDFALGWWITVPTFMFLLWYSMYLRIVPDLFVAAGSYWAFDKPNALTMAYGIPNFQSKDQVSYRAPSARQSYMNLLPNKPQRQPTFESKSPMQRTTGDQKTLVE